MIVKNEEKHLAGCLNSVKDVVDEIVIVDTGSTDNTVSIAEQYGAKIFYFDWINDFSAARNYALSKSTGDWILYLDADERLDPNSKAELKSITKTKNKIGFYCTVKSLDSEHGRDNQMTYVRLFARNNNITFNGSVHEQIIPSLLNNGYEINKSNILIEHIGYDINTNLKKEKAKRNLELLIQEYRKSKNPYLEFQLALTHEILENYSEAKKYFLLAAENKSFNTLYRAHSYTSLSVIFNNEHNINEACRFLEKSLLIRDNDAFTHLLAAKVYLRRNDIKKAIEHCNKAELFNNDLMNGKGNTDYSVFLNEEEIILCGLTIAKKAGDNNLQKNYYRKFINYVNSSRLIEKEKYVSTIEKLIENKPIDLSESVTITKYANNQNLPILVYILKEYSEMNSKLELLEKLLDLFPEDLELKKCLGEFYIMCNEHQKAAEIYLNLAETRNDDPSIYFYLLSFYITDGNYDGLFQTIKLIEEKFFNIPEVMERMSLIKSKLTGVPSN
jgi:glycosyltransferase involved in cell wall biosynthesis